MQLRKVYLAGFLTERRHNIVNGGYGSTNNKQDVCVYIYMYTHIPFVKAGHLGLYAYPDCS